MTGREGHQMLKFALKIQISSTSMSATNIES